MFMCLLQCTNDIKYKFCENGPRPASENAVNFCNEIREKLDVFEEMRARRKGGKRNDVAREMKNSS